MKKILSRLVVGNINIDKVTGDGIEEEVKFKLISIVIPYYNEKENLKLIIERLYELYKNQNVELIIVDLNSDLKNAIFDILKYKDFKNKIN